MIKDSKTRFQQPAFKSRLVQARSYKRSPAKINDSEKNIFSALGLSSLRSKIVLGTVLLLAGYFLYIPNFLYISQITVVAPEEIVGQVRAETERYFKEHALLAQQNIILLSKADLSAFLLSGNNQLLSLKIQKKFFKTLVISVTQRQNAIKLQSAQQAYAVSADGIIMEALDPQGTTSLPTVLLDTGQNLTVGSKIFEPHSLKTITGLWQKIPEKLHFQVSSVSLDQIPPLRLTVFLQNGFQLMLDPAADFETSLKKAALVYAELDKRQQAGLLYLDMRLPTKAFACLKNAPCAKDTATVSTSTETSTNILIP